MPARAPNHAQVLPFRHLALAEWRRLSIGGAAVIVDLSVAWLMRRTRLAPAWTPGYALPGLAAWATGLSAYPTVAVTYIASAIGVTAGSIALHRRGISAGADVARRVRERQGPAWAVRRITARLLIGLCSGLREKGILPGRSKLRRGSAHLPFGTTQGSPS